MDQYKMEFKLNPDLRNPDYQEIGFNVTGLDSIKQAGFVPFWRRQGGERRNAFLGAVGLRSIGGRMYADVKGQPTHVDGRPLGVVLEEWLNIYAGFYAEHLTQIDAAEAASRERAEIERQKADERLREMCGLEAVTT